MKKILLFVVVAFLSSSAFAITGYYIGSGPPFYSTTAAACTAWASDGVVENGLNCKSVSRNGTAAIQYTSIPCQVGEYWNGSSCVPQAPPPPPPADCQAGRTTEKMLSAGTRTPDGGTTDMAAPTNVAGCTVSNPELLGCYSTAAAPDTIMCRWRVTETGESNGTSEDGKQPLPEPTAPAPESTVPPFNPAQGQGCPKGTVNMGTDSSGGSICGGTGSAPGAPPQPPITTKPPVTTTNSDGSTTKTEVTERLNKDGSTTTTTRTTTTKADGTQTVTEGESTGKNASGGTGKKDATKDEIKDDFCKQHPELNVCKNSTVSGSCETLSCTGDAIQCTIAREVSKQRCKAEKDEADVKAGAHYQTGQKAENGTITGLPKPDNAQAINVQTGLDQTAFLGGGSCFADKSFVIQGQTIVIPFSQACDYLIVFRYAIMILAGLVCFRLLSGTFLKE